MWNHVASEAQNHHEYTTTPNSSNQEDGFPNDASHNAEAVAVNMAAAAAAAYGNTPNSEASVLCSLPNPPTLANLEEIADIIAAAQVRIYSLYKVCEESSVEWS